MPHPTPATLVSRTPLSAALLASVGAIEDAAPGQLRPDFEIFTTPMATYGVVDPLTKAVTPLDAGGTYPYDRELARFAQKMAAGKMSDGDIDDLLALPRPVVRMTGSSSEQDLEGDIMSRDALDDMTRVRDNLTIFRDHHYSLPDDMVGSLVGKPWIQLQDGIADLWLQASIAIRNLNALRIYNQVAEGASHGTSGGFMVTESLWIDRTTGKPVDNQAAVSFEDVMAGTVSLMVVHTKAVEWSTVGIPANQRSWVGGATKGLFRRTGHPLLAPLARGYAADSRDWLKLLRGANVTDAQRRDLEDLPPRTSIAPQGTILYSLPGEGAWSYQAKVGKNWRELTRGEVAQLLTTALTRSVETPATGAAPATTNADLTTKGASGKTTWPLAERDRAWDAGAAHKRLLEWAGGVEGGDGLSIAKFKSVHLWYDAGAPGNVGSYKMPFCDVVDGSVKAIPRGIFACTGSHGVDAAEIPDADRAAVKKKIEALYARMRAEFDDDTLYPSWQQAPGGTNGDGKAVTEASVTLTKAKGPKVAADGSHAHEGFGDTEPHAHTHEDDADHGEENLAKAGEPEVVGAFDGTTLSVRAEGETLVAKAATAPIAVIQESLPAACKNCEKAVPEGHASMQCAVCGHCLNCAYGPIPASARKCAGCGVKMSLAPEDGDGDADEKGARPDLAKTLTPSSGASGASGAATPAAALKSAPLKSVPLKSVPLDVDTNVSPTQRQALLASYNGLGMLLGFAPVEVDGTRSGDPDLAKAAPWAATPESAQRVISLVSDIDGMVDFLCQANIYGIDAKVDELMQCLGIPDIDDDAKVAPEDASEMPAQVPGQTYPYIAHAGAHPHLHKEGKRNSKADYADMQAIHDSIMRLTDGAVCKAANYEEQGDRTPPEGGAGNSEEDARETDDAQAGKMRADTHRGKGLDPELLAASTTANAEVARALTDFGATVKGFDLPVLAKQIETMRATAERAATAYLDLERKQAELAEAERALRAEQAALRKNGASLHDQQRWLADQIDTLANVPLGRPTAFNRTLDLDDPMTRAGTATTDDMRRVNADNALAAKGVAPGASDLSLEAALALTTVENVDGVDFRVWPKGLIPAGGRPELSNWAKTTMSWAEMSAYREGGEALVPTRDEALEAVAAAAS